MCLAAGSARVVEGEFDRIQHCTAASMVDIGEFIADRKRRRRSKTAENHRDRQSMSLSVQSFAIQIDTFFRRFTRMRMILRFERMPTLLNFVRNVYSTGDEFSWQPISRRCIRCLRKSIINCASNAFPRGSSSWLIPATRLPHATTRAIRITLQSRKWHAGRGTWHRCHPCPCIACRRTVMPIHSP